MACNLHGEGETCHSFLVVWGSKLSGVLHKKNRNVKLEKSCHDCTDGWVSTWFNMVRPLSPWCSTPTIPLLGDGHGWWPSPNWFPTPSKSITQRWYNEGREVVRCFNHIKKSHESSPIPCGITWNWWVRAPLIRCWKTTNSSRQSTIGCPKDLPQKFTERGLSSPTASGWEFNLGRWPTG